jgi:manganese/zinc/iron transport system permease protein
MSLYNLFTQGEWIQLLLLLSYSISFSLLGTFLFLKKKTMIANAISHTVLFGIALLFIGMKVFSGQTYFTLLSLNIGIYVLVSIITALITIFLIEILKRVIHLNSDASTALVFSTLFSLGVILITMFTQSSHVGVDIIMGNIDLIHIDDLKIGMMILVLSTLFISVFFKELVVISFDETFSHFSSKKPMIVQCAFLCLTSLSITCGFRYIGIAPVLGLISIPPVTASLYARNVKELIYYSVVSNILISILSIALTKMIYEKLGVGLSTSGTLVTLHFFLLLFLLRKKGRQIHIEAQE